MKTANEIYADMKSSWESETGLSLSEGGDMSIRMRAAAWELEALWAQADFVARQAFPQTACGEYLSYHGEVRGIERAAAAKSSGILRFSIDAALEGDLTVPAGTACMTAAETAFVTSAAGTIRAGTLFCDVAASAALSGAGGNVPAGAIAHMALPPTGVAACVNPAPFTGGADGEDDESLRARVLASYRKLPNGANRAYYEEQAMAVPGVAAVTVLPKARGAGTVDVVVASPKGMPSAALVAAVLSALDSQREICVDIAVAAPAAVTVDVTAALASAPGYAFADVQAAAGAALDAFFCGDRLGKRVLRAELAQALWSVPGVANYALSVPAADVTADSDQLPVLGTVTLTEMT